MKVSHIIFAIVVVAMFAGYTIVFDTFPRSTFSELEKRDLAAFPEFSWDKLFSGEYTKEISSWFSDSEPYRDTFMAWSMEFDQAKRLSIGDDDVKIQISQDNAAISNSQEVSGNEAGAEEYPDSLNLEDNAKLANSGIIIAGSGENVRALMIFGGGSKGGGAYAEVVNKYRETFGSKVNIYSMTIPNSIEFYCPEKVKKYSNPQRPFIENIHSLLASGVKAVDAYMALRRHTDEDIYLRTDHHWAPLGAYYAAEAFAKVAGVSFKPLDNYDRRVVKNFVGSMYGYSKDISVKKAPEDFVYYVPKGVDYATTYIVYDVNKNYQVTRESKPMAGPYFYKFNDGSGGAYSTFMGSDKKLTQVKTSTKNGRKVLIIKDSYGNALPGYLFYSFEEVHVVDARYFTKNMKRYVEGHKITDILFAFNVFNAYSSSFSKKVERYLSQPDGTTYPADKPDEETNDTVKLKTKQQESAVEREDLPTENNVDKSEHTGANSKGEKVDSIP